MLLPLLLALAAAPAPAALNDVAFLEGRWVGTVGAMETEEIWGAPSGDSMAGAFRLLSGGRTVVYEFLVIEQTAAGPVLRFKHFAPGPGLVSREARDESMNLPLVRTGANEAVFEGKSPEGKLVRITYRRPSPDRLVSLLDREGDSGVQRDEFLYTLAATGGGEPPPKRERDPWLDRLTGSWDLTGTIQGRPVRQRVTASWTLNDSFVEVHFLDMATPPGYEARVFVGYDATSERYVAHWLDVFGPRFANTLGYGRREGEAVDFLFEYPDGPFHNVMRWHPAETRWSFLLRTKNREGAWVTFAEQEMRPRPDVRPR